MDNIFYDIGLVIIVATFIAYFARFLKQPLILAYLLGGIAIGPVGFKLISNADVITTLAEIGIAFFLFIVGLEMNLGNLKKLGKPIMFAGVGQVVFTLIISYFICLFFFSPLVSLIIAFAITSSSTMVVVKLLSDKGELETLHGRIAVGILLVQDIAAILALSFLQTNGVTSLLIVSSLTKGILLLSTTLFASFFIIPYIFKLAARSQELLFASTVAWLFLVSIFANLLGFGIAIGAFVAGVTLAQLDYRLEIISRVKPIRDFFTIIFFVSLGMIIVPSLPSAAFAPIVLLTLFVIFGNPLVVVIIMGLIGFGKKVSFLTGISIGQASEFSLIFATQAFIVGMLDQNSLSIVTIITAITLVTTTYFIKYSKEIYARLDKPLSIFEIRKKKIYELSHKPEDHFDAVLFGCDRVGYSILKTFKKLKYKFLVVDFNPEVIHDLASQRINCLYGDFDDPEIIKNINLKRPKLFISTIPDHRANIRLITKVREASKKAIIFVTATSINEALELYNKGADYVIMPHFLGGEHASYIVENLREKGIIKTKVKHIEDLKNRKSLKQEHSKR